MADSVAQINILVIETFYRGHIHGQDETDA